MGYAIRSLHDGQTNVVVERRSSHKAERHSTFCLIPFKIRFKQFSAACANYRICVVFNCILHVRYVGISRYSNASFQRFRDDNPVDEAGRFKLVNDSGSHRLMISKAKLSDAGRISIRAENAAGQQTTSARLIVNGTMMCGCVVNALRISPAIWCTLEYTLEYKKCCLNTLD